MTAGEALLLVAMLMLASMLHDVSPAASFVVLMVLSALVIVGLLLKGDNRHG